LASALHSYVPISEFKVIFTGLLYRSQI